MVHKIFPILLCALLLSAMPAANAQAATLTAQAISSHPQDVTRIDTSNWKTHCVGRYLIDLPLDANIKLTANIGGNPILWRKDLAKESAKAEAQKKNRFIQVN